jgi:curli production protein
MNTLILLAALSSQITFKTSQQENMTTIIPQVTLTEPCDCQVQIVSVRKGRGDKVRPDSKIPFLYPLIRRLI